MPAELDYFFRAFFDDGSTYGQWPDDCAVLADSGSAYTDVLWLQREQGKRLVAFALCGPGLLGDAVAAVHLDDGHFELGGNEFYAGTDGLDDPTIERRLIYYRAVTQTREQDVIAATGEPVSAWRETTHTRYVIGWQATINGKNVQHVIALDG